MEAAYYAPPPSKKNKIIWSPELQFEPVAQRNPIRLEGQRERRELVLNNKNGFGGFFTWIWQIFFKLSLKEFFFNELQTLFILADNKNKG